MAIITVAAPLSAIRGKVGGVVYSANASGPFCKSWIKPVNPRTNSQIVRRGRFSQFPSLWADLTDAQRADWRTYAAAGPQALVNSLGVTYYASGYNWFCKVNAQLASCGHAYRTTYPTNARPSDPTVNFLRIYDGPDASTRTTILGFTSGMFTGYDIIGFLAFRTMDGCVSTFRQFRLVLAKVQYSVTVAKFAIEMSSAFGYPTASWLGYMSVARQESHGQRSGFDDISCSVTAHP